MSAEEAKPPPFYCPSCGKKHRADLSALHGRAGAHAKVVCARCEVVMSLFLGDDGLPKCEVREEAPAPIESQATASPVAATAEATAPSDGGTMSKSNLPMQLIAAAVVAGVVSFAVVMATKSSDAPDAQPQDGRVAALEAKVQDLEARLASAGSGKEDWKTALQALETKLQGAITSNATGLNAQGKTLSSIEQLQTKTNQSVKKIETAYDGLNGRIEGNYTALRKADRRLKTLESK